MKQKLLFLLSIIVGFVAVTVLKSTFAPVSQELRLVPLSPVRVRPERRAPRQRSLDFKIDVKRIFDFTASLMGLIALSPALLVIALAVRLSSPGPVFYMGERVGRSGRLFKVYKFRSMYVGSDKRGPAVTTADDSRVTPVGRILRRAKLDELPQLINVLRGEMSLVGPRPESPRYVAMYTPEQRKVLNVRPGITSPASVCYRNEEAILSGSDWEARYVKEVMPAKLAIDLNYAQKPSLGQDVKIIFETFAAILK